MKRPLITVIICLALFACMKLNAFAGFSFQDFEPDNGSNPYGWHMGSIMYTWAGLVNAPEPVHSGTRSWKLITDHYTYWAKTGIGSQVSPGDTNLNLSRNDRLLIWVYSIPQWGGHNTLGVTFFDNGAYAQNGFEVWTTNKAIYMQWTPLYILLSQLPPDFDLQHINRIVVCMYWPGTYYFDDVTVLRQDRAYQTFEPSLRGNPGPEEYGWKWNDVDTVNFAGGQEPVKEGGNSWKLTTAQKWGGTGIQSQEKGIYWNEDLGQYEQSFWHVDLHPEKNTNLQLWVCQLADNGMDNNLGVQFYDHGSHHTDDTKAVVWPNKACRYGGWTRVVIPFSQLPDTFNLHEIDKIQLQEYWPGTYYFDDIRATGKILTIKEPNLAAGVVTWNKISEAARYFLEESRVGPNGPWNEVYKGASNAYNVTRLTKLWYRVRWREKTTTDSPLPYYSDYSDVVQYTPPSIYINKTRLVQGFVEWPSIPAANVYEVQTATSENGPWSPIYRGAYVSNWLRATNNNWYRVRAIQEINNSVSSMTNWSKPQIYQPNKRFLRAVGTAIKDRDGNGKEVVLQGINLGSLFSIEKWMTGIGETDSPPVEDEWTMRKILTNRFGAAGAKELLDTYQNAYITDVDLDNLVNLGINFVRLPIYYRILQNDNGTWVTDASGQIDFSIIDRIVNYCADRGIYVLLDLHGAPGSQNNEAHSGRQNFNKLFENTTAGETYRNRTIGLWKAIATHYKNNQAVCGYDLLNEPIGAPTLESLWQLYDRIYDAIRLIDTNHIIVMEGIWNQDVQDWDTLPKPQDMGWQNVAYQFHYYLWNANEDLNSHMNYIGQKVAESKTKQALYNVPLIIGEFNCFGMKPIWEYYLQNFNREKWSWAAWSYKIRYSPSEWGLYNHSGYNVSLPKIRADSLNALKQKFLKYATLTYHSKNFTLSELIRDYSVPATTKPFIKSISPETQSPQSEVAIKGVNFGASTGIVFFEGNPVPIISWSDNLIRFYVRYTEPKRCGMVTVRVGNDISNEIVLHLM
jgi:endoglucanase